MMVDWVGGTRKVLEIRTVISTENYSIFFSVCRSNIEITAKYRFAKYLLRLVIDRISW